LTRANQEFVDSRWSHPSTEERTPRKKKPPIDPNFTKAMEGFIRKPCPERQTRKDRIDRRNEVLRALYESRG